MKTSNKNSDSGDNSGDNSGGDKPASFWEKNKKWIKPTAIGVTGLGLVFLGIKLLHKPKSPAPATTTQLSGMKSRKKKKKGGQSRKKKQAVAYM